MAGGGYSYTFTVTFPTRNEAPCGAIIKLDVVPWTDTYLLLFNCGSISSAKTEASYIPGNSYYRSGSLAVAITSLIDGLCTISVNSGISMTQSNVHIAPVYVSDLDTVLNGS